MEGIKNHLVSKVVTFQSMNEDVKGKGTFARIIRETVKVS